MRHISATAPTRICDCGGWTDTWFARHGLVFHIAIEPGVRVDVDARVRAPHEPAAMIEATSFGESYAFTPGGGTWGPQPLIEAAITSIGIPAGLHIHVRVQSGIPPGASAGTSAAVCVALVGALMTLAGKAPALDEVAAAAHAVETRWLGQQSGVQDQLAAAYGGVNMIEIDAYPHARVHPVSLTPVILGELQSRLMLVCMRRSHRSTAVHEQVIKDVSDIGPNHTALVELRRTASAARDAAVSGNFKGLGRAMIDASQAQRRLHSAIVSAESQWVMGLARSHRAVGWKVNGAGGNGGSLTLLFGPDHGSRPRFESALDAAQLNCRIIPLRIGADGLRVTESSSPD